MRLMRLAAITQAAILCLVSPPLLAQTSRPEAQAVTRVAAPLRESPAVESRSLLTIPPKTTVSVTSCADGWCAVEHQHLTGHVIQVFLRFPAAEAVSEAPKVSGGKGYTNSQGEWVPSPTRTADGQQPAGASARCRDNTFSFSRSRRGTCSHHGGVASWL